MTLLTIEEPAAPVRHPLWRSRHALWALGFRPFYILAALFAALAVPAWLGRYALWYDGWPTITLGWHMHEMVFGFAVAVVVGFLFTAGRAWTGLWTPRGGHLAALALLWVAGRVCMLTGPAWLAAVVDGAFLPCAAWSMYRVLKRAGNKRNLFLAGLLALLATANLAFHGAVLELVPVSLSAPVHAGILLIVVIEAVIGGRVIPMFTDNAAAGPKSVPSARGDRIAIATLVAASLAWLAGAPGAVVAVLCASAACASALRLARWHPRRALAVPLLWILHASYAWIPAGFVLLGLSALGIGAASTGLHALTVGSMAGLIIGMMTRTTLGHTGRRLAAGKAEVAMFVLIQAGAVLRVGAALAPADWRNALLGASGLAWTLCFALYLVVYVPYLWHARLDGKEG